MKIRDLLNEIKTILSTLPAVTSAQDDPITLFTAYAHNKLIDTLTKRMGNNPEKEITPDDIDAIIALQHEFFEVIRDTDSVPTHAPHSQLTSLLLILAQQLETITGKSRYELLFPTVNVIEYAASATSLTDKDLLLTHFVLSDDNQSIIEVAGSLNFAVDSGELRNTRLFEGQMKRLSTAEAERVVNHSQEAKAYWEAIQAKLDISTRGESFGAVLQRLCNDLKKGGAHGNHGGSELNSGADANIGIKNFFDWHAALTDDERTSLEGYGLGDALGRLARPASTEYQAVRYCVEMIAGNIETILNNNPALYTLYPQNKIATQSGALEQAHERVIAAGKTLISAMSRSNYQVTSSYGDMGKIRLYTNVVKLHDLQNYAEKELRSFFRTPSSVNRFLEQQQPENRMDVFYCIQESIMAIDYPTWARIASLIIQFPEDTQKMGVVKVLAGKICDLISNVDDLDRISKDFKLDSLPILGNILYQQNPDLFHGNHKNMLYLVNEMASPKLSKTILEKLTTDFTPLFCQGPELFKALITKTALPKIFYDKFLSCFFDTQKFTQLLFRSESSWEAIFTALSPAIQSSKISTDNQLFSIFQNIPEYKKISFLHFCPVIIEDKTHFSALVMPTLKYWQLEYIRNNTAQFSHLIIQKENQRQLTFKIPISTSPNITHALSAAVTSNTSSLTGKKRKATDAIGIDSEIHDRALLLEQEYFRKIIAELNPYGLTEEYLRAHIISSERYPYMSRHSLLIYLVTGTCPRCVALSPPPDLRAEQRMTPAQAIAEIHNLDSDQRSALENLYAYGLRSAHLRAFQPAQGQQYGMDHFFSMEHKWLLEHLMIEQNPALRPELAMQRINGLTRDQAKTLWLEGRRSNQTNRAMRM